MQDILRRNNVKVIGHGKPFMIFAHGFGCDQNTWRHIVPAFEKDYTIVLFDYVGAGNSDLTAYDEMRYSNLNGYAEDVLEICRELKINDAIFVGHSVSSMIGTLAAIAEPTFFSKLLFVSPSPCYKNDNGYSGGMESNDLEDLLEVMDSNYLGWSQSMASVVMGNADKPELGQALANSFCSTDPEIAKQFARVTFMSDTRSQLQNLTVESRTLQCVEDPLAPTEVGAYIQEHTPENSMVILSATGHCPHLSSPMEIIKQLEVFLN
ncbi:alpha/beta hydrolase [Segetibacter sp. 3557_3]|uniref:alpha/beta fold hydrolase n=1 Tax=Segetibacter sp. 3557_3 TaxID=2547429 RepID=UPI0010584236|nr:alpha/beta hydrolase [Segetibacter sp. 3557_3]TDH23458.1 alpha/beta hydrolase [Segetibacter sp. 3557_3]